MAHPEPSATGGGFDEQPLPPQPPSLTPIAEDGPARPSSGTAAAAAAATASASPRGSRVLQQPTSQPRRPLPSRSLSAQAIRVPMSGSTPLRGLPQLDTSGVQRSGSVSSNQSRVSRASAGTGPSAASPAVRTGATPARRRSRSHTVSVALSPTSPSNNTAPSRYANFLRMPDAEEGRASDADERRSSINVIMPDEHDTAVADHDGELHDDVVGLLDVVDPEVGTVNHLQNVTNGIMFPNIPALWTRRPNLVLPRTPSDHSLPEYADDGDEARLNGPSRRTSLGKSGGRSRSNTVKRFLPGGGDKDKIDLGPLSPTEDVPLKEVVSKQMDEELTEEADEVADEHELDRHVKHVLRAKRREKAKRALRGLWAFLKTPMGIVTGIYGFLVAFWGAALVLFLLGWIKTPNKHWKDKWVEICSQIVNGLFTLTGVGLIPWRVIDTYRMSIIHTLKMKDRRLRKKAGLPPIDDPDDLPDPRTIPGFQQVLSEKDQDQLRYQQDKFAKSQTWYRPHANATHRAFPITLALWNTILMDGNSFFQCLLCGCMWGMNYHKRPAWTTGSLIPLSFLCGIAAGVLIWQGGVRTKKTKAVEDKLREALGVDQPVDPQVRRPRRATISGLEQKHEAELGDPIDSGKYHPKRRATIDITPDAPGNIPKQLGSVSESSEDSDELAKVGSKLTPTTELPVLPELLHKREPRGSI